MSLIEKIYVALVLRFLRRNEFESLPLRRLFLDRFGINVGLYSYGCFDTSRIPRDTTIGRYCSFARTATIFNGNHGIDFLSTHPYLYNVSLGLVDTETIQRTACLVEDDVWLGHNSIILPSVKTVGRGSIVAAGSVVTKDVPRYAIVAGSPARVIKFRFSKEIIDAIESSRWWEWDKEELRKAIKLKPNFVYKPVVSLS